DFGIARAAAAASSAATAGRAVGTPAYMAPEQVEGAADIDARADIYAFGAMVYEMVTGACAWNGDSPYTVALMRLRLPPPDPREQNRKVPDALATFIMRCMAREPAERYASANELIGALTASAVSTTPSTAPPSSIAFSETQVAGAAARPQAQVWTPSQDV